LAMYILQIHSKVMWYLLLSHRNNAWTNAPQCYVLRKMPIF